MPLTVAPPPRNGDAAQGRWFSDAPALAAADPVGAPPDAPEPAPTLPAPAAIARTVAAGVLLAAAALRRRRRRSCSLIAAFAPGRSRATRG